MSSVKYAALAKQIVSVNASKKTSKVLSLQRILKATDDAVEVLRKDLLLTATVDSEHENENQQQEQPKEGTATPLQPFGAFPPSEDFIHIPLEERKRSGISSANSISSSTPIRFADHPASRGMTTDVLNSGSSFGVSSTAFGTVIASVALRRGKYMYETTVETDGVLQIGWSLLPSQTPCDAGRGVGDFPNTYAYDGHRKIVWNQVQHDVPRHGWAAGDVISTTIDLEAGLLSFYLNGKFVLRSEIMTERNRPDRVPEGDGGSGGAPLYYYCPSIAVSRGDSCLVNLGGQRFLFPVKGFDPIQLSVLPSSTFFLEEDDDDEEEDEIGSTTSESDAPALSMEEKAQSKEWRDRRSARLKNSIGESSSIDSLMVREKLRLFVEIVKTAHDDDVLGTGEQTAVGMKLLTLPSHSDNTQLLWSEACLVAAVDTILCLQGKEHQSAVVHVGKMLTKVLRPDQLTVVVGQLFNLWGQNVMSRQLSWPNYEASLALFCIQQFVKVPELRREWTSSPHFTVDFKRCFTVKGPNPKDAEELLTMDAGEQYARGDLLYKTAIAVEDECRAEIFSALARDEVCSSKLLATLKGMLVELKLKQRRGEERKKSISEDGMFARLFICCVKEVVAVADESCSRESNSSVAEDLAPWPFDVEKLTRKFAPTWSLTKQTLIDLEIGRIGGRYSHVSRTTPVPDELKEVPASSETAGGEYRNYSPLLTVACALYSLGAKHRVMDAGECILLRQAADMMEELNEEQVRESERAKLQCGWDYTTLWAIREEELYMKFATIISSVLTTYHESPVFRYIPEFFVDTWIAVMQYVRRTSDDYPATLQTYPHGLMLLIKLFMDPRLNHDLSDMLTNSTIAMLDTYEPNRMATVAAFSKDLDSFLMFIRSLCSLFGHKMAWTTAVTALMRFFGGSTFCNTKLLMDDPLQYDYVFPHRKRTTTSCFLPPTKFEHGFEFYSAAFRCYIDRRYWNHQPTKVDGATTRKATVAELLRDATEGTDGEDDAENFMENLQAVLQADQRSGSSSVATAEECNIITFIKNLADHINFTLTELGAYLHDLPERVVSQEDKSKLRKTASLFELTRGLLHCLEFLVQPSVSGWQSKRSGLFVLEGMAPATPTPRHSPTTPTPALNNNKGTPGLPDSAGTFPTRATPTSLLESVAPSEGGANNNSSTSAGEKPPQQQQQQTIDPITITRMISELIGQCLSRIPSAATREQVDKFQDALKQFTIETEHYTHSALVAPIVGILHSMTDGGRSLDPATNPFLCQFASNNVEWSMDQIRFSFKEFNWVEMEEALFLSSPCNISGEGRDDNGGRFPTPPTSPASPPSGSASLSKKKARGFVDNQSIYDAFEKCSHLRVANSTNDKFNDDSGVIEDGICVICATNDLDTEFEPCGHTSCEKCIKRHLMNSDRCFFCNVKVDRIKPIKKE